MNDTRTKYVCNKCSYKFSRKNEVSFRQCPYCGKEGTIEIYKADYASKLIGEVSSLGI